MNESEETGGHDAKESPKVDEHPLAGKPSFAFFFCVLLSYFLDSFFLLRFSPPR